MLQAALWALACSGRLASPAVAAPPTAIVSDAVPVEHVEAGAYNLTATYDAGPNSGAIRLVFDRRDEQNAYLLNVTKRGSRLTKLVEGRSRPLSTGPGLRAMASSPIQLTVARRPGLIRAFCGPTLIAEAHDATFEGGACGSADGPDVWAPSDLFVQEIGPIRLEDDFFAGDDREDLWEPLIGKFHVGIYWDPKQKRDSRPIGASWYANDGPGEHMAAVGDEFWDDYAGEVSARPAADSTVGLAFRVHGPNNYGLLSLATEGDEGVARLSEVVAGEQHVLAERRGRWPADEWHRLRVEVADSQAIGLVNGEPIGRADLAGYRWGRAGLYAKTDGDCRFDDLVVRGIQRLEPAARTQPHGPWAFPSGAWKAAKGRLSCRAASVGIAVASLGALGDCDVRSTVRLGKGAEAGLLTRWVGPEAYCFVVRQEGDRLSCHVGKLGANGESSVLAAGTCASPGEAPLELGLRSDGIALQGFVNGSCVVKAWDGDIASGAAGLVVSDGQASFEGFRADGPPSSETGLVLAADGSGLTRPGAQHGLFQRFVGDLWAPLSGKCRLTSADDEPCIELQQGALRFYTRVPGDVRLSADLLKLTAGSVDLAICTDGKTADTGYRLSAGDGHLALSRNGEVAASVPLTDQGQPPLRLSLLRDGPHVVGIVGRQVATLYDREPLESGYALIQAKGAALLDNVALAADHTLSYRFDRVEPDWVASSGEWLFHSGMACIPWAYWLTADGREEPAFSWNRNLIPPDVAVSFDVSEYTTGYESGSHEHYPYHDISLVLAAEERHPDSGYRFVIGAEGGRCTQLYRKGEMVHQTSDPRLTIVMGPHCNTPRAIEVFASKHGGSLRLVLNGVEALTYDDPVPLEAGLIGLGAAKCRANFRDVFLYRDRTWASPMGATQFSPR